VYPENAADSTAFITEVKRVREVFGLETVALVGDRGTLGSRHINELKRTGDSLGGWVGYGLQGEPSGAAGERWDDPAVAIR
jgi:hypothetical protein